MYKLKNEFDTPSLANGAVISELEAINPEYLDTIGCPDFCREYDLCLLNQFKALYSPQFNLMSTLFSKATKAGELGLIDKAEEYWNTIDDLNNLTTLLMLINLESDIYEFTDKISPLPNISKEELKCVSDNFACRGYDISCIIAAQEQIQSVEQTPDPYKCKCVTRKPRAQTLPKTTARKFSNGVIEYKKSESANKK